MKDRYAHIPKKFKNGNCYKEAITFMLHHRAEGLLLCHGWVSGKNELQGVRFSHAWVEDPKQNIVFDPSPDRVQDPLTVPKFVYYAIGNIIEERVLKYDYKAMMKWIEKTEKAGPWEKQFDE